MTPLFDSFLTVTRSVQYCTEVMKHLKHLRSDPVGTMIAYGTGNATRETCWTLFMTARTVLFADNIRTVNTYRRHTTSICVPTVVFLLGGHDGVLTRTCRKTHRRHLKSPIREQRRVPARKGAAQAVGVESDGSSGSSFEAASIVAGQVGRFLSSFGRGEDVATRKEVLQELFIKNPRVVAAKLMALKRLLATRSGKALKLQSPSGEINHLGDSSIDIVPNKYWVSSILLSNIVDIIQDAGPIIVIVSL